ncbi:MAG TPA: class I SAM-dependent methyltransferase [Micromonosporaceae bacterium]|nr:class I SAM-dependent methyltransferase [Micromonosporaceae bacterium]
MPEVGLDEVRRDWTKLGAEDPLWAVLVAPDKRGGHWAVDEFLATGRADVDEMIGWLTGLGLPVRWERALDFGCGVGRLSQALAGHADEVVGVDIASSMLDTARRLDRSDGVCRYVLNDSPDLGQFPDGHFDLVYTALVLQHLPRPAIDRYLAEFLRVLRPGGTAVVQVPTRPLWTVRGVIWRFAPYRLIAWGQRRVLGYPAPMRMTGVPDRAVTALVTAHGGEIVDRRDDLPYTPDWQCTRYVLRRKP